MTIACRPVDGRHTVPTRWLVDLRPCDSVRRSEDFGSYRRTWKEDVPSWQAEKVDLIRHPRAIVAATDYQPLDDAVPSGARRRSRLSH
ncbi:hypothetical protein ACQR0Z_22030 [Bradyrhizobium sp. HKCCYLS3077]|uniref:hypothetical protein n=1 Tax=Bradyrhizobium sp. HKCCYLS3077 TaxID=3420761 RepID=UPI003EBDBEBE